MSSNLGDILSRRRSSEPREFAIIREFVTEHFAVSPKLSVSNKGIVIGMPNSAAAGSLRLSLHQLQELCGEQYRLSIRIS